MNGKALFLACFSLVGGMSAGGGEFDRAIETVLPRVVKLYGLGTGQQVGYGTGVLVSSDGLVLTVFSLLIDARKVRAVTEDGTVLEAEVVRRDAKRQLALLRLRQSGGGTQGDTAPRPFPYFDLACTASGDANSPAALKPGDWVVVAGNPFKVADGAEPVTVSHGLFSARTRMDARRGVKDFPYRGEVLVLDTVTSNPGAPGSAVVDLDGRFVGMVGREVISNLTHTHFNYAMPRDVLCEFLLEAAAPPGMAASAEAMSSTEPPASRDPGIRLVRTGYQRLPPMVERVRRGSLAERAGVRPDDLILSVNGRQVADVEEYAERLESVSSDEPIELVIRRDRTIHSIRIEAEKKP